MQKLMINVEMIDGTIHENIRVINPDLIRHAEVATRHKWPTNIEDDPVRAQTFLAFAAMQRLGLFDQNSGYETAKNEIAWIDMQEETEPVDPTP